MNILVFSWRDPKHPLAGGAEQVMHEHMKGWVEAGHSVTYFSSAVSGAPSHEVVDGISMIRKGSQYLTVHIAAFIWYTFLSHPKFDVVVDEFHGWPFFTPLYVRAPKLAVIQEVTRKVWFHYPLPLGLNYVFGAIGYVLEPTFFWFYRSVPFITGSESAKRELSSMGIKASHITVVPHGVIIEHPTKRITKEKTNTVVFLGALAKDKGIEDALKVFEILQSKGTYQFWIIGKGDSQYATHLKALAKKYGISKKTTFWGFVSQEEKFELLSRAHVMINPSIREGWGLVNIEANAMKTPVIAYPSAGLIDSVQNNKTGIIVSESTPDALATAVDVLMRDAKKLSVLQKGAFEWSTRFNWESSRKLSLSLLTKAAKRVH